MSKDLLDRLKAWHDDWPAQEICKEAIDEIERLRAALQILYNDRTGRYTRADAFDVARTALEPTPGRKTG